jgi:hypothetical protein
MTINKKVTVKYRGIILNSLFFKKITGCSQYLLLSMLVKMINPLIKKKISTPMDPQNLASGVGK